jgi:hypothetical protein
VAVSPLLPTLTRAPLRPTLAPTPRLLRLRVKPGSNDLRRWNRQLISEPLQPVATAAGDLAGVAVTPVLTHSRFLYLRSQPQPS